MNKKLANVISTVGHPLLTIPVFLVIVLFSYQHLYNATTISALIIIFFFIPISIKMYVGSKKGTYTNFDVSDRNERQSWYVVALFLLSILILILFYTNQAKAIIWTALFFFLLLLISKLLNYYIKSSLHVSLNVFLTFLIIPFNLYFGIIFLFFVLSISWSRIVLKRHTLKEVIYGGMVGSFIGLSSLVSTSGYIQLHS
jgi:membrane-associated phospholipid phosphatase